MKWLFFACAVCLVAVSAGFNLNDLGKSLDPKVIASGIENAVGQVAGEQAPGEQVDGEQAPADQAAPTEEELNSSKKLSTSPQGSTADRTRLLSTLFTDYNKKINPDNVLLKFGVTLIDFHVCDKRNVLDSYVWLKYIWEDSRLKWEPSEYGGAELIRLEASEVWKPDVTLYNSADPVNMINCWDSNVLIYSTGKIMWVPPCKMTSQCHYTLKKHPYGEQTCTLKFGSWTFDGNILDLGFYNETTTLDLSDLNNSSGFEVVSTSGERHEKFYSCCVEPYPDITFNLTIKRIPGEELFNKM